MKTSEKNYQKLCELSKHARILQGISSLLDWDQETYMPPGSASIRADQLKAMAGIIHREKTSREFSSTLSELIDLSSGQLKVEDLSLQKAAALREWRRDYLQDTALSIEFVEEFTQVTSQAIMAWRSAKAENSFQKFAPFLDRIVELSRKKADLLGYSAHPYDALLNQYEPGITTTQVTTLFSKLCENLAPLIKKIASKPLENHFLFGNWDQNKQIAFSHLLLEKMGYDTNKGRLDFSSHPFSSSSHPTDSRITTRLHPTSLMSNISAVLHEGGHALYEMGLSQDLYGTPLGDARSLGIHESQSRWWETRIGLSRPFWKYFFPLLQETFKGQLNSISQEDFYLAINKVKPSFIRVEADEVTYPMHVILRFEIEKALIEGSLKVREIPEAWNAKMQELLGITPSTNAEGCLQDIHWAMGGFGYFPTYTLGNLYAAHLFEGFVKDYPNWDKKVEEGELGFIKMWLHEKIYKHGKYYETADLLKQATGKEFSADPYLNYLQKKYQGIYKI